MTEEVKKYTNGEINIIWQSGKCIHSGNCVRNLPGVFKPHERPWITMENADTEHLIETVEKCPSGALTWEKVKSEKSAKKTVEASNPAELSLLKDGPILVKGKFALVDSEGNEVACKDQIALCRCGASMNKPFCDGAHRKIGFKE